MSKRQDRIAELTGKLDAMRLDLRDLQELEFEEVIAPQMRENIGRCYKYRNSYSCPSDQSDYWWMYVRVVGMRDGCYRLLCFQRDKYKALMIRETTTDSLGDRYKPIAQAEFVAAVTPWLEAIGKEVNWGSHS